MNLPINLPLKVASFSADTLNTPSSGTSGNFIHFGNGNNRTKQIAIDSNADLKFRIHNGVSWGSWKRVLTE